MKSIGKLKNRRFLRLLVVVVFFIVSANITQNVEALMWTQTDQTDFEAASTKINVDVTSNPGNVTLIPSPTDWVKAQGNPVLDVGPAGSWDDLAVDFPSVMKDGDIYKMWYSGYDGSLSHKRRIGYAISDDGITWTKPNLGLFNYGGSTDNNIVLVNGPVGSWDQDWVAFPTIIKDDGLYKMWYSGWSINYDRIGYAESLDGINWTKSASNPVLSIGANWESYQVGQPIVIKVESAYHMWYYGSTGLGTNARIGHATSNNGIIWTKDPLNPVLTPTVPWEGSNVEHPTVILDSGMYKMWYSGWDGSNWRIGYAISTDGTIWTKYAINPVLNLGLAESWDDFSVQGASMIKDENIHRMWYTGCDGLKQRIGHAVSPDSINWTKRAVNPVLDIGKSGEWNSYDVYSPSVLKEDNVYKMWYTGNDGVNSRIGYAWSSDGIVWTEESSNPVLDLGSPGAWDDYYVYFATVLRDPLSGDLLMWYSGYDENVGRIGLANSSDGVLWTKNASNPILDVGNGWEALGVGGPSVLYDSDELTFKWKMWYQGYDGIYWRIGYAVSEDGATWLRHPYNPVLNLGPSGSWDDRHVYYPHVVKDDSLYRMWYTGHDGTNWRVGYAESFDGVNWTKSSLNPILNLGSRGSWDSTAVLDVMVLKDGSAYKMWYTGADGGLINCIGYATAAYGSRFVKQPANPVLDVGPSGSWEAGRTDFPFVRYENGIYRMWYTGAPAKGIELSQIGLATSTDGYIWKRWSSNPIIPLGAGGQIDSFSVNAHSILYENDNYKMWYSGSDAVNTNKIGYAVSSDGVNWTRFSGNPVLDYNASSWDNGDLMGVSVLNESGIYRMWYAGWDWHGWKWYIGYAYSTDGISWIRPNLGLFTFNGNRDNNLILVPNPEEHVHSPYILKEGDGSYSMWYGCRYGLWQICYAHSPDGFNWTKYPSNPVLPVSLGLYSKAVIFPFVLKEDGIYRMWFGSYDGTAVRICHAVSSDGINWTRRAVNPVLSRGTASEWDSNGVSHRTIINQSGIYKMWYAGKDSANTWRIGYAESIDGLLWNKYSTNPVLSNGPSGSWDGEHLAGPCVMWDEASGLYKMWYTGYSGSWRIGYATSLDGLAWTKYDDPSTTTPPFAKSDPVLKGTSGVWDESGVFVPFVMKEGGLYKMWYSGVQANIQMIGYAMSTDGINWTKVPAPVLTIGSAGSWEDGYVDSPSVLREGGIYHMIYSGSSQAPAHRIGHAFSIDGITWVKSLLNPVLGYGNPGTFDSSEVATPVVLKEDGIYKLWYYANDGDAIGYAISSYLSTGFFESTVFDLGRLGTDWEATLFFNATLPSNTFISFSTRTSVDNSTWSPWSSEITISGSPITSPIGRYIQYRAILISLDAKYTPILHDVTISYQLYLAATIDCDPDTLNLGSRGKWITCYIELPEGNDPRDIVASTILLNDIISPELGEKYGFVKSESSYIMDHDGDGISERMVKFDRTQVQSILDIGDSIELTITGELADETIFEGSDAIRVIDE